MVMMNMMMDLADIFISPMIMRPVVVAVVVVSGVVHVVMVGVAIDHLADFTITVISPRLRFRSIHRSLIMVSSLSLILRSQDVTVPADIILPLSQIPRMVLDVHLPLPPDPVARILIRIRIRNPPTSTLIPILILEKISSGSGLPSVELGPSEDDQAIRPTLGSSGGCEGVEGCSRRCR